MKVFLLFYLFLPCFVFAQISQLSIVGQPQRSQSEIVAVLDVNGRECAAVQVISDMDGFKYQANKEVVRVDDEPGKDMVFLQPDERVLEIYHTGYEPLKIILSEIGIQLRPRQVWIIKVAGEKKATELNIGIITTPSGAEVFIDGKNKGTGEQHIVSIGSHEIRLTKSGYQPVQATINVDEKSTLFRYELKKQEEVNVRIETEPSGATIYIDGTKIGDAPVAEFFPAGRYPIRIEKEWYLTVEEFIDIQPPRIKQQYKLQPNFSELVVSSVPQSGLDIFLDGVNQNSKTPATIKPLKPGVYKVRARSSDYETDEQEILLVRGEQMAVKLTSLASFATLTIHSVAGAKITLDGKVLTQLENIRMAPAVVLVRAEAAKAPPVEQRVVLRKGESQTIELMSQVPRGTILVTALPEEARIELKGDASEMFSAIGDKVFSDIPIGSYTLRVVLSGYQEYQETITLKPGDRVNKSIKLQKPVVPTPPILQRESKTGIKWVLIKGGTFDMGDNFGDGYADEKPVHSVTVPDFYLGKTEVTVAQYRAFCNATSRTMPIAPNWGWQDSHPIVNVSWNDATAFCQWAGCRLPTEAEWEYAARGGGNDEKWAGTSQESSLGEYAWYDANSGNKTHPVATKRANGLGLYDMSGNVWEWCADWYDENYYNGSPSMNPQGPSSGTYRVLRGGSWVSNDRYTRCSNRHRVSPGYGDNVSGFRVARSAQ